MKPPKVKEKRLIEGNVEEVKVVEGARATEKEWRQVKAFVKNKVKWRAFVDTLCSQEE